MKRAIRAVEIGCRVSADLRRNLLSKHRHREERSDAAIQRPERLDGFASLTMTTARDFGTALCPFKC
jgi:hypothetical protein